MCSADQSPNLEVKGSVVEAELPAQPIPYVELFITYISSNHLSDLEVFHLCVQLSKVPHQR